MYVPATMDTRLMQIGNTIANQCAGTDVSMVFVHLLIIVNVTSDTKKSTKRVNRFVRNLARMVFARHRTYANAKQVTAVRKMALADLIALAVAPMAGASVLIRVAVTSAG